MEPFTKLPNIRRKVEIAASQLNLRPNALCSFANRNFETSHQHVQLGAACITRRSKESAIVLLLRSGKKRDRVRDCSSFLSSFSLSARPLEGEPELELLAPARRTGEKSPISVSANDVALGKVQLGVGEEEHPWCLPRIGNLFKNPERETACQRTRGWQASARAKSGPLPVLLFLKASLTRTALALDQ